jgi:hypothetical protein
LISSDDFALAADSPENETLKGVKFLLANYSVDLDNLYADGLMGLAP